MQGKIPTTVSSIYISCPIRGIRVTPEMYGTTAATEIVEQNCKMADELQTKLKSMFPNATIHNPGNPDLERFVQEAVRSGTLKEKDILNIDCNIISNSEFVIFFNHETLFGRGMLVEYNYVVANNKPFTVIASITEVR